MPHDTTSNRYSTLKTTHCHVCTFSKIDVLFFYLSNHAVPLSIDVFSVPSIGHEVKVVGKTHNFCQPLEDIDAEAFAAVLLGPSSLHPQTERTTCEKEVTVKKFTFLKKICFSDICLLLQPVWSACLVRAGCSENKTDRRVLVRKTNKKATITKGLRVDRC